jgi:serine/threonine protein kinase
MTNDPLIGIKFSNFRIERLLGRGGMAQVYYGQDVKLQRPVAIKIIDARYRGDPAYARRFIKEARAVARWRHENIIQIYYADDQDGLYYYVMEYIDGQDLAGLMASHATRGDLLPSAEVLRIGNAIASALDYAHSQGIIHRDVKPSNVLLSKDGRVILSDFGLALDLQEGSSGEVFGTPNYISPEQARRSTDAVPQSDLYSLGVILYEMLTGVVPFDDLSPTSIALQHITQPPPTPRSLNPQINIETEKVLLKALSKEPKERYQTGKALMDALEIALSGTRPAPERILPLPPMPAAILAGKTRGVTRKVTPPLSAGAIRRWPFFIGIGAILLVALLVWWFGLRPGGSAAPILLAKVTSTLAPTQTTLDVLPLTDATSTPLAVVVPTNMVTVSPTFTPTPLPSSTFTSTVSPTPVPSLSPTLTVSASDTVALAVEFTSTSSPTMTPSSIPAPTTTPTITPTIQAPLPHPEPTATVTITPTITLTPTVTTTQQYDNYKRLWLYYDQYGFYIYNASDANRSISPISFVRLDQSGTALNRFDGWRWAEFFPTLFTARCMRIQILNNPNDYFEPPLCKGYYLSTRKIAADSDLIFWTAQPNSAHFQVLWKDKDGNESVVGQCEIKPGFCEVFVP